MGFLREYGIIMAIVMTIAVAGYIWHERGVLDSGKTVADTQKTVEPIQEHEFVIGAHPLDGPALLDSLHHYKY